MRMNELMEASGLTRATITHWVKQGLLPEPVKTSRNMAYYAPQSVERAKLIQSLKARHLPLAKIKQLLEMKDKGLDPHLLLEVNRMIFGEPDSKSLSLSQYCRAAGLSEKQVDELARAGLLLPFAGGRYDSLDLAIGRVYRQVLEAGASPGDLSFYALRARQIVDQEMRLRRRLTKKMSYDAEAALTSQLVRSARSMRNYVIDRTFQLRAGADQEVKAEDLAGSSIEKGN